MRTTMRTIEKVVERFRQVPRLMRVVKESRGLINTTDLLVATAATVVLAAGVGSAALSTLSESKYGKAQPDAQAFGSAISQFYKDTGKWPGQAEHAALAPGSVKPAYFLATSTEDTNLASGSDTAALTLTTECSNNSLEGFTSVSITGGNVKSALTSNHVGNINDFLVKNPGVNYQNWKGPYLTGGAVETDPWDRAWVFNLAALYCAEDVTSAESLAATGKGTTLGNAWVLTAGNNRTLTTSFQSGGLDKTGDDAGTNMGKLVAKLVTQ